MLRPKATLNIPKTITVPNNLDEVRKKHAEKTAEKDQKPLHKKQPLKDKKIEYTALKAALNEYAEAEGSDFRRIMLRNAEISVQGNTVSVILINPTEKEKFQQIQIKLKAYLTKTLENDYIKLESIVKTLPPEKKKSYTAEEKFKELAAEFPALKQLKSMLDLDFK